MSDEEDDMPDAYLPPEPKRQRRLKYKYTALLDQSKETLAFLVMNQRRQINELQRAAAKDSTLVAQYQRLVADLRIDLHRCRMERAKLISDASWIDSDGSYR